MKKLLVLLVFVSCKKDDVKPTPVPTPVPVVNHYELNVSAKPAVYTQTASPLNPSTTNDSTFFELSVNGNVKKSDQMRSSLSNNVILSDSAKTGDQILLLVRMRTHTQNAKECTFKLNKAWLLNGSETVLSSAVTVTIPVVYTDSVGRASHTWTFTAP